MTGAICRRSIALVLFFCAMFIESSMAQTRPDDWEGWAKGIALKPLGWTFDSTNGDGSIAIYLRAASAPSEDHQLWVREEFSQTMPSGYHSSAALWEFSCASGKKRRMRSMFYEGNNLDGRVVFRQIEPRDWEEFAPGTYEQGAWNRACGKPQGHR